jgi:acyl transferase domain-containing protein
MSDQRAESLVDGVAVIGLAGRFPGATSVAEFWRNLRDGVESISFFTETEMTGGARPGNSRWVQAAGVLADVESFDAPFFNFNQREAEVTDPQHRIFLECAWEALEDAGYDAARYAGPIGVYAGAGVNTYLLHLNSYENFKELVGSFHTTIGNEKDYLSTRVSYKLNLRGPSLTIQTACSTSLVAISLACESLLAYQCDMALAGGVTVRAPQQAGYLYQEGGIMSPDGHCRAFDAQAGGTVGGNGAGVVLLKRLEDALADGDHIYAVVRGFAVNNDGAAKISYTAPSEDGQAQAIYMAQAMADIQPETISYVEAHGTATPLGDPIEVAALKSVFQAGTARKNFCALGSVKTNVGHLDAAAGVAGFIKTVLALKHKQLPPSLHFERPNPEIDFADSPFYVNATLQDWPASDTPRRAGVSSFGIGGTNAHVVLEEAPAAESADEARAQQLIVLSARTAPALEAMTANLLAHLRGHDDVNLADVAYTLQVGRKGFGQRRALVCRDAADAIAALAGTDVGRVITNAVAAGEAAEAVEPSVAFMLPGQGEQFVGMSLELYRSEPVFRAQMDACAELLTPHLGFDLRTVLYADEADAEAARKLDTTAVTQPALFAVEYALAQTWLAWGVAPQAMIGHSLGEYVAACLAGVFSLEDALALVAARGRLMQTTRDGAMLAVSLPEQECRALFGEQLSLAAVNAPERCVVAGPAAAVAALAQSLEARGVGCRRLRSAHAFHSSMMERAARQFAAEVAQVELMPPQIPFVSNVTGTWITASEAVDPEYWARHMLATVRFADGLDELLQEPRLLLEVGPGNTLSTLAARHPRRGGAQVVSSLGPRGGRDSEQAAVLAALGRLWVAGVGVDWAAFSAAESRRRVSLPTYPFERKRCWLESKSQTDAAQPTQEATASHRQSQPESPAAQPAAEPEGARRENVSARLRAVLADLVGIEPGAVAASANFLELGIDSLLLIQLNQAVQVEFGVQLSLRQLLDELSTVETLSAHLAASLPPVEPLVAQPAAEVATEAKDSPAQQQTTATESEQAVVAARVGQTPASELERVLSRQLETMSRLMSEQLEVLRGRVGSPETAVEVAAAPHAAAAIVTAKLPSATRAADVLVAAQPDNADADARHNPEPFVPYRPITAEQPETLDPRAEQHLRALVERLGQRTRESKRRAEANRQFHANNRYTAAFRHLWKELVYPVVVERAAGSRVWDVDGNEYVDLTMGFGALLFGHSPAFVVEALERHLRHGIQLGFESGQAGEVARLISELTGQERVAFCNSGTEAVMAALRLARARTGRSRIALFRGSYHGTFDGVLVRGQKTADSQLRPVPLAPGVPPEMVKDVLLLDYCSPDALATLEAHAHELAAVLVEPKPSRRPDVQPENFLRQLRRFTAEAGVPLIFDEVVTGFRVAPGGVQSLLGIKADLTTYGKAVGGGLPIGIVAGKAAYMDAIDGGRWHYGDTSYPQAEKTYIAGTFFQHPMVMASAWAVLNHIKESGPALYEQLNGRTERLVKAVTERFERVGAPLGVAHFKSLFNFSITPGQKHAELFFYHLLDKGIYVWEGRVCYLSTAHTDEDVDLIVRAVDESVTAMQAGGFFPSTTTLQPATRPAGATDAVAVSAAAGRRLPLTEAQRGLWILAQMSGDAARAYNESSVLRLRGRLRLEALRRAFTEVVARHEALRTTFSPDGESQLVWPAVKVDIPCTDLAHLDERARATQTTEIVRAVTTRAFDLVQGPLFRAHVVRLGADEHVLIFNAHHIIFDGLSITVLQKEVSAFYSAACAGQACELPPPAQFGDYVRQQTDRQRSPELKSAEDYWLNRFATLGPPLDLPTTRPRPAVQSYRGDRHRMNLDAGLLRDVQRLSAARGATPFMVLLAGFKALLRQLSEQEDIVVGVHSSGQRASGGRDIIGYCINTLPLRSLMTGELTFAALLDCVKTSLLEAYAHQDYPFSRLIKKMKLVREPGRLPLVSVIFNLDRIASAQPFFGLQVEGYEDQPAFARFDLLWNITWTNDACWLSVCYNADLFNATTVRHWGDTYQALLRALVARPDATLRELAESVAEDERRRRTTQARELEATNARKLDAVVRRTIRVPAQA